MAGVKISALPAISTSPGTAPLLTDIFPEVQPAIGGTTYRTTFQQLLTLYQANIVTPANGGVLYTDATQVQLLAPTAIAGLALLSGSNAAPTWSSAPPLLKSGGTMTGAINMGTFQINNAGNPTLAQDLATKFYVDSVAQGLTFQGACRVASTAALTVTYANGAAGVGATLTNAGAQVALAIDGVTLALNDRVLVKNQASALQNGIYTATNLGSGATNWVMTRATDYDQVAEINPGDLVLITAGTTNTNSSWVETATVATIGVDSINFSQFSAALPISVANGGTGLTTTTAYGLITGGTTATGNFQNAGTGASGTILQGNGAAALPTFSTATYPATTTINQLLYSSSNNVVGGVTAANSSILTSGAGGIPAWQTFNTTKSNLNTCSFAAKRSANIANVTGDGTQYVVVFDSVLDNVGSHYDAGTGIFSAPATGLYSFTTTIDLTGLGVAHTACFAEFLVNAGDFFVYDGSGGTAAVTELAVNGALIWPLTAGDTVKVNVQASNSTKTVGVGANARFSGYFLG